MSLLDRAARFIDDVLLLPDDLREALEEAEEALLAGKASAAERRLRGVLDERPSLLRARQALALALEAQGKVEDARAVVRFSRQLDPDEPEVALLAARLALAAEDWDETIAEAREAGRHLNAPGRPLAEAAYYRARGEAARGRSDRAVRELRKAIAADPGWMAPRLELVRAMASSSAPRRVLEAAAPLRVDDFPPDEQAEVGRLLSEAGHSARSVPWLEAAASVGQPAATTTLAEQALRRGDPEAAVRRAREAVANGGGAESLAVLGVALADSAPADAVEALLAAAAPGRPRWAVMAGRLVPLDDASLLGRVAAALPEEEGALRAALGAWRGLARGDLNAAEAALRMSADEPRAMLAAARIALDRGQPQAALGHLSASVPDRWDEVRAADLRRRALRALWRGPDGEVELAAAIDEVARFAEARDLEALGRRARSLRDELDRPLLLAVLGEFNAGKSTLVNAFVGSDVVPTGILPTTATLNVLRGGAERKVRVVRTDGTTREGAYDDLRRLLDEADDGEERIVDHVEIVLPSELLERVWILDTPGSNAPVDNHEALAREATRRADAALWIFDARQAGKATEGRVLEAIRASRREVVAALNKVDRLKEGELEAIRGALATALPAIGPKAVAVSAKGALKATLADDEAALADSGFPELRRRLEAEVFDRAPQLKRRAMGGRLLDLLDAALATEAEAAAAEESRIAALAAARVHLERWDGVLTAVRDATDGLDRELQAAFRAAAGEVLGFVRPRRNRFASHGVDREDRAFLAELIAGRVESALTRCGDRLVSALGALLAPVAGALGEPEERLGTRLDAHVSPTLARFGGYQLGALEGGALARFFTEVLPRAELALPPLAEALDQARVPAAEALREPLDAAILSLRGELLTAVDEARTEAEGQLRGLREGTFAPLRALRTVLEELVDAPPGPGATAEQDP